MSEWTRNRFKEYVTYWRNLTWYERFFHRVWWRLRTLKVAIFGGLTPGEKLLLGLLEDVSNELDKNK